MLEQPWPDTLMSMRVPSSSEAELLGQIQRIAPEANAELLLRIARDVVGGERDSKRYNATVLGICQVMAQEGALVQEMAGEIAQEMAQA